VKLNDPTCAILTYNYLQSDADANIRDHSGKKPMQYLVRQDTELSVDSYRSEFLVPKGKPRSRINVPRRGHSTASNFSFFNPARLPILELPLIEVSLPTCNSNATTPNLPLPPNSDPKKVLTIPDQTDTLAASQSSPTLSSGPVKLLLYGSLRRKKDKSPSAKDKSHATSSLDGLKTIDTNGNVNLNVSPNKSSLLTLNPSNSGPSKPVNRQHNHLKNSDGMRSSFRRGIKKMVDSW
jgi:hypothetical protein